MIQRPAKCLPAVLAGRDSRPQIRRSSERDVWRTETRCGASLFSRAPTQYRLSDAVSGFVAPAVVLSGSNVKAQERLARILGVQVQHLPGCIESWRPHLVGASAAVARSSMPGWSRSF